ncbi:XrtA system polysaccharide chain length determinant [Lysobacter hankyongensis]|uniref:Polysaccharide chain length determinant N-terminal domain-containing protein n=1 Tax=Lysobacter hankyongensis TaxID=1176535 RepID=A0ABP9ASJ5_9GAMM
MSAPMLPLRRTPAARAGAQGASSALAPNELIPALLHEARRYQLVLVSIFAVIALLALLAGLFLLPRKYVASTSVLAQESDIIQPLLENRAHATRAVDRAGLARTVVFGRRVMSQVLEAGGWMADRPSAAVQDKLIEQIRDRTQITNARENLVQITYHDNDAERAFKVADAMANLLIEESLASKERESREAYEFIDKQVADYHRKLTEAEANLQDYRSANADAQPGSATDVTTRIGALRTQVEQTRMSLMELRSREDALASQLSGESAVTSVQTRETLYRTQLLELQNQLDTLLLSYTDKHPDVVRIRHQMADIQTAMAEDQNRRQQPGTRNEAEARVNPMYQELRSRLAETRREIAAIQSRMSASEGLLDGELGRSRRIAASESTLAELTRDYEVNRDIYQDMLRRRENARVSMELDRERRGLTMRIQDPAQMPLRPSGLRFMHFALGGLAAAVAVPLGLLFLLVRFDPRVRAPGQIERQGNYPVLTVVPGYRTPRDRRREFARMSLSASILGSVIVAYGLVYLFKQIHA